MFIKLTAVIFNNRHTVYVNPIHIMKMIEMDDKGDVAKTGIYFSEDKIYVRETIEEILRMIEPIKITF